MNMAQDNRIYLFDSTLRDGAQTQGVDFSVADKTAMARALDNLGIDYVEGGWPGANPTDDVFFRELPELRAKFTAFGMTRRPGRSVENDPGLAALINVNTAAVCMVGKTWDYHVDVARDPREENVEMISESIAYGKYKTLVRFYLMLSIFLMDIQMNPQYALSCVKAA